MDDSDDRGDDLEQQETDADPDVADEEMPAAALLLTGLDEDDEATRRLDPYATIASNETEEVLPTTPDGWAKRGEEQMANGQISDALTNYREAVRTSPDDGERAENRVTLGDAYAYSGQGLNAYRQYKRAIKTAPRRAEPHFSLAELFQRYGRLQSAIGEYRKAISFAPENAYYRYKLGDALAQSGDLEGAVSELEEASHLKPQDSFYHFWLGDLYLRAARTDDAIREMQQAALFSPYDAYYNVRLGAVYRRAGLIKDAATAVRHAVKIAPDNGAYHCLLADLYSEMQMDNRSIHHYQAAGILDDYDTEMLRRLRRLSGLEDEVLALDAPDDMAV